MLISNPDLLNSCRVCRSPNQDGEYECLYRNSQRTEEKPELTAAGILYENMLGITLNMWNYYPQFLCNSCDLQMKLFKKLKDKAYKTLEYLQGLHKEEYETEEVKSLDTVVEGEHIAGENYLNESEENYSNDMTVGKDVLDNEARFSFDEGTQIEICAIAEEEQLEMHSPCIDGKQNIKEETCELQNIFCLDTEELSKNQLKEVQVLELTESVEDKMSEIKLRLDANNVIDNNDYVTEIYVTNNEIFDEKEEILDDYDIYEEANTETSSVFNDVEYILEEATDIFLGEEDIKDLEPNNLNPVKKRKTNNNKTTLENNTKKKEYKCHCQLVFKNLQEYKNHRKEVHNGKYSCSVCTKEMKSLSALYTHMKLHNEQPAYQCEICQKNFSQKCHFQYHMNSHNNVRNFKCSVCEKAFLSNSDLKIHMRSHTGQRPYVCNICGKDYLMMEHLKAHALIHSQELFQCDICLHKFATHKTLRTHIKTIHEDEPRFKCTYCGKAFRRKHHLEYHLRSHQKNFKSIDKEFELINPDSPDDCQSMLGYNTDDLIDQELVDDPGFIAI